MSAILATFLLAAPDTADAWHQRRIARLTAEDGWLSLVALHWLAPGETTMGSGPDAALKLPAGGPALVGTFHREGDEVRFTPAPGVTVVRDGTSTPFAGGVLRDDGGGRPSDVLRLGTVRFQLIRRGERLGVRVKDARAPARTGFTGIERYPVSEQFRVQGRFIPAASPVTVDVPTVLGTVDPMPSPGDVVFTLDGKELRLRAVLEPGETDLFFIFADQTNRDATYGAGRFLYASPPRDGMVILDFNRAYNPPCAFTAFATCPLPPRVNRLPVRIEAGEKRYGDH